MLKNSIKLPRPAAVTIEDALDQFLDDQRRRLKEKTLRNYEDIVYLFKDSMNGYAHQSLDTAESALFDHHYNADGDQHREFCQLFGPQKIPENVAEFLGYFMVRKVMCGQEMKRAAGTVTKKLGKWLAQKGYVEEDDAAEMTDRGAEAVQDLPAADELADMLIEYTDRTAPFCEEAWEDHFDIKAVEPGKLHLSPLSGDEQMVVPVSRAISDRCRVGWSISGAVGQTSKGWRLLEVWNVYP